ncbi:MAG: LysM peptidoglycan-binding domain-containing protein [Acidimicrobiales bacterium]|nr:LysM peptidoglycan-binding domain-containing protein [Acidimicrobiales bacterium]
MAALVFSPQQSTLAHLRPVLKAIEGPEVGGTQSAGCYWRRRVGVAVLAVALAWLTIGVVLPAAIRFLGLSTPASMSSSMVTTDTSAPGSTTHPAIARASSSARPRQLGVADGTSAQGTSYLVRPGDTLWSIAKRVRPSGDLRPIVDELASRTGGGPLQPGQRIVLDGLDD